MSKEKILDLDSLVAKVHELKRAGKTVVQSHGVFDLIHPGIVKHLSAARVQGDFLVVTIIKDEDVRRGPGRPVFNDMHRAESVAALSIVDFVCIVSDYPAFESVQRIQPDIFAKGQAYKEKNRLIHEKIFEEEKELYFGKIKIHETGGFSWSSSGIINQMLDVYSEETKRYLRDISQKYAFSDIQKKLDSLKHMKVLLIGDGIVDEYFYCESMSKSGKAHLIVNKYSGHEIFAGGAFAIANHISMFCGSVNLVTLLGGGDSREDFIRQNLAPVVSAKYFYRPDSPTIIKRRYLNPYLNQKLFEINYINDQYIDGETEQSVLEYLEKEIPTYDLVLVSDFGHGFITKKIMQCIEKCSPVLAINTQTNGANAGYNLITKYTKPNYVCLDEPEARLAMQDKFGDIESVARDISKSLNTDYLIVTLGKKGSIALSKDGDVSRTPIFSPKVIDTVGAGDAFFAYTAPCFAKGMPLDLVSFIGNVVGALAVQIVGNKKPVEKHEVLEFIHAILKQ